LFRYNHNPARRAHAAARVANSISLYHFFQFVKERTASLIAKDQT